MANLRYEEVTPMSFKNGDIVEMRVAFIRYPLHDGGCKVVLTMRSLILISSEAQEVSCIISNRSLSPILISL
jgi:hypothetical protein